MAWFPELMPDPKNWDALRTWLWDTVTELARQIASPTLPEYHSEPAKRQPGMVVVADGTNWNPGSGRGAYRWDPNTGTWRFLG